jgi:hypothetical protein
MDAEHTLIIHGCVEENLGDGRELWEGQNTFDIPPASSEESRIDREGLKARGGRKGVQGFEDVGRHEAAGEGQASEVGTGAEHPCARYETDRRVDRESSEALERGDLSIRRRELASSNAPSTSNRQSFEL